MVRCENCGKRNPDPLCASCLHYKKKQAQKEAAEAAKGVEAPASRPAPDKDELRDRMRRIEEGLRE